MRVGIDESRSAVQPEPPLPQERLGLGGGSGARRASPTAAARRASRSRRRARGPRRRPPAAAPGRGAPPRRPRERRAGPRARSRPPAGCEATADGRGRERPRSPVGGRRGEAGRSTARGRPGTPGDAPWNKTPRAVQARARRSASCGEKTGRVHLGGVVDSRRRSAISAALAQRGPAVASRRNASAHHRREVPRHSTSSRKLFPSTSGRRPQTRAQVRRGGVGGREPLRPQDVLDRAERDPLALEGGAGGARPADDGRALSLALAGGCGRAAAPDDEPARLVGHGPSASGAGSRSGSAAARS